MENESDTVILHVFGLRTVVPKPVTTRANLNLTWYEFLNDVCGIKVEPGDAVMAATTSYSAVTKRGWCADLSEKIRVFVERFSLKRDKYSVRLMMQLPNYPNPDQTSDATVTVDENVLFNSHSSTRNTSSTKRASTRRTRSRISSNVTETYTSGSHAYEGEDDNPMDADMNGPLEAENYQEDERPDNVFESPPAPVRASHSRRKPGTNQNEDLKVLIKSRVRKLGNPFLHRVQKEIKKLQRNQLWYRNVQYAPLASYLLQEVFTDE